MKIFNRKKVHIVSGNPEVLYRGLDDKILFDNFTSDDSLIIPDGVGTQIAGKMLKTPVSEKIAGIEVMKEIITKCEESGESYISCRSRRGDFKGLCGKFKKESSKTNYCRI